MKEMSFSLEEKYQEVFKTPPQKAQPEEPNFEQPYFGRIVETVTTYAVGDAPAPKE